MGFADNCLVQLRAIYHADRGEKLLVVPQYEVQAGPVRKHTQRATMAIPLSWNPTVGACLGFGVTSAYFVPEHLRHTFEGKMPIQAPEGWIKLPPQLMETGQAGLYCMPLPATGAGPNGSGMMLIQPATATVALGRRYQAMVKNPEWFNLDLADRCLNFLPTDVPAFPPLDPTELNDRQAQAVAMGLGSPLTLVEGPPGTGKSALLVELIARCVQRGERVAVVASSNEAVDSVALKLLAEIKRDPEAPIALCARLGQISRYGRLDPALKPFAPQGLPEDQVTNDKVSFMTIFRIIAFDLHRFDVVIIDEAGAVGLPWLYALAALAHLRVVGVGDGRQNEPFLAYRQVKKEVREIFESSLFAHLDLAWKPGALPDPRVVRLTSQYRMRDDLAEMVRRLEIYERYETPQAMPVINSPSFPHTASLSVLDTSALGSDYAEGTNPITRQATLDLVSRWKREMPNLEVAIITPYAAQCAVYESFLKEVEWRHVRVGTVHRFQGREATAVVFDVVDGAGARYSLTNNEQSNKAAQVINVAISRSRAKLVVVGEVQAWRKDLPASAFLLRVVAYAEEVGSLVPAPLPLDPRDDKPGSFSAMPDLIEPAQLIPQFLADAALACQEISIFSEEPDPGYCAAILAHAAGWKASLHVFTNRKRVPDVLLSHAVTLRPPSAWPHKSAQIVFDGRLQYGGGVDLLGGDCSPTMWRRVKG